MRTMQLSSDRRSRGHAITAFNDDVDYTGDQKIFAWYQMLDLPLASYLKVIGGARFESTDLSITNLPESDNARYLPPGGTGWTQFGPEADVAFPQDDVLPSSAIEVTPIPPVKIRASCSETVARQGQDQQGRNLEEPAHAISSWQTRSWIPRTLWQR